ncbi:MAG: hypothetical protein FGM60_04465 [Candidatus Planktophila sp.]|nr:hypothetical protein [Candidatus Planktophila sp.]
MTTNHLSDELIKQIYFYCENNDKDGLFPDEVDILEFGKKLEAVLTPIIRRQEHIRCVGIVSMLNKEVSSVLAEKRP